MDKIPIEIQLQNEVESLENRLRCYHEGTYGRSVVKMHVELKKIERIKDLLEQRQETRPHETIVILREALQKELEAFKESEKSVETSQGHAHYEGIYIGLKIAINHIIQIEHPTK